MVALRQRALDAPSARVHSAGRRDRIAGDQFGQLDGRDQPTAGPGQVERRVRGGLVVVQASHGQRLDKREWRPDAQSWADLADNDKVDLRAARRFEVLAKRLVAHAMRALRMRLEPRGIIPLPDRRQDVNLTFRRVRSHRANNLGHGFVDETTDFLLHLSPPSDVDC
jgi:hypothetical protein